MRTRVLSASFSLALACCAFAVPAQAAPISLSAPHVAQLQSWLGGAYVLTQIFSKEGGDGQTATAFHAAVGGQGATISVFRGRDQGEQYPVELFGGYNPRSWGDDYYYQITEADADRTAFLFNLSTLEKQDQKLSSHPNGSEGQYQTYNDPTYGPTFGGGHDLQAGTSLETGIVFNYTYGPSAYTDAIYGPGASSPMIFDALAVYSICELDAPAPVPEPSTLLLLGIGLAGVGVRLRRTQGKS